MKELMNDRTALLYAYTICVVCFGAYLFISEWVLMKWKSIEFRSITVMMVGFVWILACNLYARYIIHTETPPALQGFVTTEMWAMRWLPVSLALTVIVGHASYKRYVKVRARQILKKDEV